MQADEADKRIRHLYTQKKAAPHPGKRLCEIRREWNQILTEGLTAEESAQAEQLISKMAENAWKCMNERSQIRMNEKTGLKKENPLGTEPVGESRCWHFLSLRLSLLSGQFDLHIVDQIFIGQGVGYLGNATTVSFPMMTIVMAFATLLGSGGGAYTAIKLGERDEKEANLTLNNLFSLSVGVEL